MRIVARATAFLGLGLLAGCGGGGGGNGGGGGSGETPAQLSAHEAAQSRTEIRKRATLQNTDFSAAAIVNSEVGADWKVNSNTIVFAEDSGNYYINVAGDIGNVPIKGGVGTAKADMQRAGSFLTRQYEAGGTQYTLSMYAPESAEQQQDFVEVGAAYFLNEDAVTAGFAGFAAGQATPVGNVPTSGSATFKGTAGAYFVDMSDTITGVAGPMSMTADFAQKTTNLSIGTLSAVSPGSSVTLPGFSGTGTINGNGFMGSLTQTGGGSMTGAYTGRLYGPQATEVGGSFAAGSGSSGFLVGGFAGKR